MLEHRIGVLEKHLEHETQCYTFLQRVVASILRGMKDQLGSVSTTLIMRSCMSIGKEMSEDERFVGDVSEWTPEVIGDKLVQVVSSPTEYAEVVEASAERVVVRKKYCRYLKIASECPDFCAMTQGIVKGFFEGVMGPCEVDIPKKLSMGDKYCEIILKPGGKK